MERQRHDQLETFLVERYWPDIDLARLQAAEPRLDAAATALTTEGRRVVYLGSILMPADEVVFSLVAAEDESVVRQLNDRAGLPADRIARAIALGDAIGRAAPGSVDRSGHHQLPGKEGSR